MIIATSAKTARSAAHANFGKSRKLISEIMERGLTPTIAERAIHPIALIVDEHTMGNEPSSAL